MVDFLRLPHFMKRRNAFREDEREKKVHAENDTSLQSIDAFLCQRNMLVDILLR